MKKVYMDFIINHGYYKRLQYGFKEFLAVEGYAACSVDRLPARIVEFLSWLEKREVYELDYLSPSYIKSYIQYLKVRANKRRGGQLSSASINKNISALKAFSRYLWAVHRVYLSVDHQRLVREQNKVAILSKAEVQLLYQAAERGGMYALRDQVILDLYYGCGLRRSEGYRLNVSDVDLHRQYLVIRRAKNGYARLVPFTPKTGRLFRVYLSHFHAKVSCPNETAFLLSIHGKRLQGGSIQARLKHLQACSGNMELCSKNIGLHTLRHSIATHLLAEGMALDYIRQFLGHRSLESTQIYTQLQDEVV